MFNITILVWLLLIGLPYFALRRGSGPTIFTGVCVILFQLLAMAIASHHVGGMAGASRVQEHVQQGVWQLAIFLPLFVLAFPLGSYINRFFQINYEPFEALISLVLGIVFAFIAVRFMLGSLVFAFAASSEYATLHSSFLVQQLVDLRGWHGFTHWMANLSTPSDNGPIASPREVNHFPDEGVLKPR
ncbi:MAG: hypothetical protein ACYDBB_23725 [Armatimonadota bacterium]